MKSLAYTSLAKLDISAQDVDDIHRIARDLNALDGITGLLVFNGTHFMQIIEGAEAAIDDLLERLRRDPRHSLLEVRDERPVDTRSFPDWTMELVHVSTRDQEAKQRLDAELPLTVPRYLRDLLIAMTEKISRDVRLD